jgi:hypothetical protein
MIYRRKPINRYNNRGNAYFLFPVSDTCLDPLNELLKDTNLISLGGPALYRVLFK